MLRRDVISLSLIKSPVLRAGALSDEVITLVEKAGHDPRYLSERRQPGSASCMGTKNDRVD